MASSVSSSTKTGYKYSPESFLEFMKKVSTDYWSRCSDVLPGLDEKEEWEVYLLKPSYVSCLVDPPNECLHHALLFKSKGKGGYFRMELSINKEKNEVRLWSDSYYPEKPVPPNSSLGYTKKRTATSIFEVALTCLADHGDYNAFINNCQDYCKVRIHTQ